MFLSEMKHFVDVIQGNSAPLSSLHDGERVLKLILIENNSETHDTLNMNRKRPLPEIVSLIVFDFDGVMTDNCALIDEDGHEQVVVNRSDGMGISLLRQQTNLSMLVLSTETNTTVAARCNKLGLPFIQGIKDKAGTLKKWLIDHYIDPNHVIYVGNDVNDMPCFSVVGCAIAPADAHPFVREKADLVLQCKGGKGAVREICDLLLSLKKYNTLQEE
jgi:N-acylneuraminate cytidylyltransferase